MRRGRTMTHNYRRHGTLDLFAAMNVPAGDVLHQTAGATPASTSWPSSSGSNYTFTAMTTCTLSSPPATRSASPKQPEARGEATDQTNRAGQFHWPSAGQKLLALDTLGL